MKTIELFSGTKSFSKVAEELGYDTYTIDLDPDLEPDCCISILSIDKIAKKDIFWSSPPCTAFSVASMGKHWKNKKPKSETAILGMKLLDKTISLIKQSNPNKWYIENPRGMTSSNGLKSVVSDYGTSVRVAIRKPLYLKHFGQRDTKVLMWGSLTPQPCETTTTFQFGGGLYDCKRISAFQSSKIQLGCEGCDSEEQFSLQAQHKLSYYLDSKISEEVINRESGRSA